MERYSWALVVNGKREAYASAKGYLQIVKLAHTWKSQNPADSVEVHQIGGVAADISK